MCVHDSPSRESIWLEQQLMKLQEIIDELVALRGDLDAAAKAQIVDADELEEALADAEPDTAEFVVLHKLAQYH